MDYEVVQVQEMLIAGLRARTKNSDVDMPLTIARLWHDFTAGGIHLSIPHQQGELLYSLYTNYESDESGEYDMVACCEVTTHEGLPEDIYTQVVPAGTYAKFVVRGHDPNMMLKFWHELSQMNILRKYTCDYEVYALQADPNEKAIEVFVAIQE